MLSLEHACYSSAGSSLASLFSPPSSGAPAVPLLSASVPLAVQSLEFISASAVTLDCLSVLLLTCFRYSRKAFKGSFDFRSRIFAIFTAASALSFDSEWYGDDMEC